jgi:hypothetical protein
MRRRHTRPPRFEGFHSAGDRGGEAERTRLAGRPILDGDAVGVRGGIGRSANFKTRSRHRSGCRDR